MKATAALVYKNRNEDVERIVASLRECRYIDEIVEHDNVADGDYKVYGRYVAAAKASNDVIYVQDDDCIVKNIDQLFESFDGTELVANMKAGMKAYDGTPDTLVGWGAVFNKWWMSALNKYIECYGEDSLLLRDADRVFTTLLPMPRRIIEADLIEFPSAMETDRLSMTKGHEYYRKEAVRRALEIKGYDAERVVI